jgi:hypothetical protein
MVTMNVSLPRRPFSTQEFHSMIEAGVFGVDDRLELIGGEVVEMAPIGHRHAASVRKLNRLFQQVGDRGVVDVQNPLTVSDRDDFYPDLVLLKPREDLYAGVIPRATDALLVVEVADTTLAFDRAVKLPRYAAAGVSEVWLVDLEGSRIWGHRRPLEGDYGEVFEARAGEVLVLPGLPDIAVKVEDVLA